MERKDMIKFFFMLNAPIVFLMLLLAVFLLVWVPTLNAMLVFMVTLSLCLLYFLVSYGLWGLFKNSFKSIEKPLHDLANGHIDTRQIQIKGYFKWTGWLANIDAIAKNMSSIWDYLEEMTQGKFDEKYVLLNDKDKIGQKLNELAASLIKNRMAIEQTKIDDEKRNWAAQGLTRFNDILRQEHQGIKEKGYALISNLVDYIGAIQGGLFVLNEENVQDSYYEMVAAIAYNRHKIIDSKVKYGESLVGRCAHEKLTIYLIEIPENYLNITSGLGDSNPRSLLLVPCILDQKVFGVIEIASFDPVEPYKIEFIEKLGENIASSIANLRTQAKTNALLDASKHQADELAAQEEELRQNLEEMEATQEDLKRQMELNLDMRKELAYEKFLFDSLLEKVPARVFFKDKESKFIKLSQSAVQKFGKNSYKEMVGMSDADFLAAEFAQKTRADELKIMNTRQGMVNFVENERLADGTEIWKTVSKIPLIDENDQCIGLFGIISDITDFKKAEIQSAQYKANYEQLFDIISQRYHVFVLNEEGKIKSMNQKVDQFFGNMTKAWQNEMIDAVFDKYRLGGPAIHSLIPDILSGKTIKTSCKYKIGTTTEHYAAHFILHQMPDNKKEIIMVGMPLN